MLPLATTGLWGAQIDTITNRERSLFDNRPRGLTQMATGSFKPKNRHKHTPMWSEENPQE
jgi:hypothetical protein